MRFGGRSISRFRSARAVERAWVCQHSGRPAMNDDLADEVLDAGNALVVRSGGQEERIALSDIKNVNYSPYMSPPQVTLSVRRHTAFGETIASSHRSAY